MPPPLVRDAAVADFPAIAAIYAHHVQTGLGSFEEGTAERRRAAGAVSGVSRRARACPCASPSWTIGWSAIATPARFTPARPTGSPCRISSNRRGLHRPRRRHGAAAGGVSMPHRQARPPDDRGGGDSGNEASLRLHARLGFRTIGAALRVAVKFGRLVDIVYGQRALGEQTTRPPAQTLSATRRWPTRRDPDAPCRAYPPLPPFAGEVAEHVRRG